MTSPWSTLLLLLGISHLQICVEGNEAFQMDRNPESPVQPGRTVAFICHIRKMALSNSVEWVKRVGQLEYSVGINQLIHAPFNRARRYSATGLQIRGDHYITILTVTGAGAEDIGQIGCKVRGSNTPVYATLAVCENPDSETCKCIDRTGWSKPSCWNDPQTLEGAQAEFRRIIIGLSVCLVIAIIFGIVMMIIVCRDVMARVMAKRAGNERMQDHMGSSVTSNPYANSEAFTADPEEIEIVSGQTTTPRRDDNVDPYAYRRNGSTRNNRKINTLNTQQSQNLPTPSKAYDEPRYTPPPSPAILSTPSKPYHGDRYSPQPSPAQLATPSKPYHEAHSPAVLSRGYDAHYTPQSTSSGMDRPMQSWNSPSIQPGRHGYDDDDYDAGPAFISSSGANV